MIEHKGFVTFTSSRSSPSHDPPPNPERVAEYVWPLEHLPDQSERCIAQQDGR
jgi:hypothetical protein